MHREVFCLPIANLKEHENGFRVTTGRAIKPLPILQLPFHLMQNWDLMAGCRIRLSMAIKLFTIGLAAIQLQLTLLCLPQGLITTLALLIGLIQIPPK